MPRYDYICPVGHMTETIKGIEVTQIDCVDCGKPAVRQSVYLFSQGNTAFVPANQRVMKMRDVEEAGAEIAYQHERINHEMDGQHQMPDYAGIATAKAQAALAGTIAPPKGWTDPHAKIR